MENKMLTKEQFRAQFKHEINAGGLAYEPYRLVYHKTFYGYKIYRLLEKLVLEDNGRYFISSID